MIKTLGEDTATPLSLAKRLRLIDSLVGLRGKRVLDCGCGAGGYVLAMAAFGADVVGIEFQAEKVTQFRSAHPDDPRVIEGDVENLSFAPASFDAILMNETIEHFPDDARALSSAHHVLRPGGHLIVLAPNRCYPFETHGILLRGTSWRLPPWVPLVPWIPKPVSRLAFRPWARNYWPWELQQLVSQAGFDIAATGYLGQTFEGISKTQPAVVRWATPILRQLVVVLERLPLLRTVATSQWIHARKSTGPADNVSRQVSELWQREV
jgi:SAM-dependent methyltransferase